MDTFWHHVERVLLACSGRRLAISEVVISMANYVRQILKEYGKNFDQSSIPQAVRTVRQCEGSGNKNENQTDESGARSCEGG